MDKASWIEVSLTVSPELAEAVAEVIGRFTREGVVIEQSADPLNNEEATKLNPQARVFGYLYAGGDVEDRKARLEEGLWYLGRIQPLPAPKYRLIHDQDWMEEWKDQYKPVTVGKRLVIVPAWMEDEFPGRIPIRINPGMAFGTGMHPSTQLCLTLLERLIEPGTTLMDIGCGSGILSAAAVKLGADKALAVDIDPASIESTRENCALNGVLNRVEIARGSAALIHGGHFGVTAGPLVVANILSTVILGMFEEGLADLVDTGGRLVLSGILEHQAAEIIARAAEEELALEETQRSEDWVALVLVK